MPIDYGQLLFNMPSNPINTSTSPYAPFLTDFQKQMQDPGMNMAGAAAVAGGLNPLTSGLANGVGAVMGQMFAPNQSATSGAAYGNSRSSSIPQMDPASQALLMQTLAQMNGQQDPYAQIKAMMAQQQQGQQQPQPQAAGASSNSGGGSAPMMAPGVSPTSAFPMPPITSLAVERLNAPMPGFNYKPRSRAYLGAFAGGGMPFPSIDQS
jgi:hypothetical protein